MHHESCLIKRVCVCVCDQAHQIIFLYHVSCICFCCCHSFMLILQLMHLQRIKSLCLKAQVMHYENLLFQVLYYSSLSAASSLQVTVYNFN